MNITSLYLAASLSLVSLLVPHPLNAQVVALTPEAQTKAANAAKAIEAPVVKGPNQNTTGAADTSAANAKNASTATVPSPNLSIEKRSAGKPVNPLTGTTLSYDRKRLEAQELDIDLQIAQKKKAIADLSGNTQLTRGVLTNGAQSTPKSTAASPAPRLSLKRRSDSAAASVAGPSSSLRATPAAALAPNSVHGQVARGVEPKLRAVSKTSNGRSVVLELPSGEVVSVAGNTTAHGIFVGEIGDSFAFVNGIKQSITSGGTIVGIASKSPIAMATVGSGFVGTPQGVQSPQAVPFQPIVGAPLIR